MSYYRHEYKFIVTQAALSVLGTRLDAIIPRDIHADNGNDGQYRIISLYFDDINMSCYYDNENGYDLRVKWRIRIYDHSDEVIFLEKKSKRHGMTHKDRCRLTKDEAMALIRGEMIKADDNTLLLEFLAQRSIRLFTPSVITVYDRTPYIYALGNVRITFDRNISSSVEFESFFDENLAVRPITASYTHLLEVKYDEYLPSFIHQALQMQGLKRSAFSKYYLCRKYSL